MGQVKPKSTCRVSGCFGSGSWNGMCSTHDYRNKAHGDPLWVPPTEAETFWGNVDRRSDSECWTYANLMRDGYGRFRRRGTRKREQAHRVAWELLRGPIPPGKVLDHMCHNKACVNPSHLRVATSKQNAENRMGPPSHNVSGALGVSWNSDRKKWIATVVHQGRNHALGRFSSVDDASAAARTKRLELFTHNDLDRRGGQ